MILILLKSSLRAMNIPFSNPTLLRKEKEGTFPRRFYLSQKTPVWKAAEVLAWIAERAATAGTPYTITKPATKGKVRRRLHTKSSEVTQ